MKAKIIVVLLIVANIATLFYAFSQKVAADQQREMAVQSHEIAEEQRKLALEAQAMAEQNAEEARRQQQIAEAQYRKVLEMAEKCK